jgi:hypothetical protein
VNDQQLEALVRILEEPFGDPSHNRMAAAAIRALRQERDAERSALRGTVAMWEATTDRLTAQVAMLREAIEDARRRSGNKLGLGADWVATADKVLAATAPAEDVR